MAFHVPNKHRLRNHPVLGTDDSMGNNGFFVFHLGDNIQVNCKASDGMGWEHVSVTVLFMDKKKQPRSPYWKEMCIVKQLFWDKDDTVLQIHPPESEYVNMHKHCLHLWRKIDFEMPLPDSKMVGIKTYKPGDEK